MILSSQRGEHLRLQILDILGDNDWTYLTLLHRGTETEKKPITICITVAEASTHPWITVGLDIVKLLDTERLFEVAVEICRGSIFNAAGVSH
jgi:hypothetical protein